MNSGGDELDSRVLVLAPTAKDAEVTRALLERGGLSAAACAGVRALTREIEAGAGAALITEEAVTSDGIDDLLAALARQPAWSELPVVMLMRGGAESPVGLRVLRALRNVTLLERPAPMRSVLSAVEAAVRSRRRQCQIRDQVEQIRQGEAGVQELLKRERAAREQAEQANRLKDDFLATVSHELRTPLNAILGWSQVLRQANDDPREVMTGVEVIERNARLQAQLIDDLLDMSRITSGKLRLDLRPVDVGACVGPAIDSVRPAAAVKGIRLDVRLHPCGPVLGDAARLQQVFWNLLSNAIKFTPRGGAVTLTCRPCKPDDRAVEVRVVDTGEGIAAPFLPYVFERFRQADGSTTRRHGGLGLGLAIVKQIVDLHGGNVEATSAGPGKGATFTVCLPPAAAGANGDAAGAPERAGRRAFDLSGVKVLVVDDDDDARALVRRILANSGAEVATAASAAEALELLAAAGADVLVSDIGMPDTDGYELMRRVRAMPARGAGGDPRVLPAIALTAFARPEDRAQALAAGYQAHLPKPLEPADLIVAVAALAPTRNAPI